MSQSESQSQSQSQSTSSRIPVPVPVGVPVAAADLRSPLLDTANRHENGNAGGYLAAGAGASDADPDGDPSEYILYPQRFLILFTFSLLSFNQSLFWLTFSPIAENAETYYGIDDFTCNWLLNWGPIIFLPALPFTFYICTIRGGLKWTVLCSSSMCSIAMILRIIPNWLWASDSPAFTANAIYFLHAAHILNAAAGPLVMSTVSQCSCLWFGVNERARATAVAIFSNNFGAAVGFLLMPALVNEPADIPKLLYTHAAMAIFASILTLAYFPVAPPTPPSHAALLIINPIQVENPIFTQEMRKVCVRFYRVAVHPSFYLLALSGGILSGIFNSWSALFDSILAPQYNQTEAGWIGFGVTLAAIVGGLVMSAVADTAAYSRRMKYLILLSCFLTFDAFLLFLAQVNTPIFTPPLLESNLVTVSLALLGCGFTLGLANPLYYELGAELTFPEAEAYSAGVITFYNNGVSILFIFVQPFFSSGAMNCLMIATVIVCSAMIVPIREVYLRRAEDERRRQINDKDKDKQQRRTSDLQLDMEEDGQGHGHGDSDGSKGNRIENGTMKKMNGDGTGNGDLLSLSRNGTSKADLSVNSTGNHAYWNGNANGNVSANFK